MAQKPTATDNKPSDETEGDRSETQLPICGMVRPIATMGDAYPETHWLEVHEIVAEAAKEAGFRLRLVSESDQVGIIVSEIIRNLHENPIVVVDVSGRNPNVMFELGMRVTFQKPVVIITDDHTPFSFDISAIKHVPYRRDLRTAPTRRFQRELTAAISATVEAAGKPGYQGYLQQFGRIEVTTINDQTVSLSELAEAVQDLKGEVRSMARIAKPPQMKSKGSVFAPMYAPGKSLVLRVPVAETPLWRDFLTERGLMSFQNVDAIDGWASVEVPGLAGESGKPLLEEAVARSLSFMVQQS